MSETPEKRILPVDKITPLSVVSRYWYLLTALALAVCAFGYWVVFYGFNDMGYAPLQPIPYSHKLHAGELGIDCKYCHFNAERSKYAGVPPISVCMGCHHPDKGAAGGDSEKVAKLLELTASVEGYDSNADYDDMDPDVTKVGGAVHWNRIHKVQDHAYFSHQWHVSAGVSCQTCHGPIEEMEVVYQHAPLGMGWCIQCHRSDNYVGGREYDGSSESFTVGVGDYSVLRQRIRPDDIVTLIPRTTAQKAAPGDADHADHGADDHAGHDHGEHAHADHGEQLRGLFPESSNDSLYNRLYLSDAQATELQRLNQHFNGVDAPRLPRWRIADLPEVHAKFYHSSDEWDEDGDGVVDQAFIADPRKLGTLQNAPTQCNTCHQ